MQITVLLFANLADEIGKHRLELEVPQGARASDALDQLAREHETIAAMRDSLAIAINDRYAAKESTLQESCTLALIPPVSGG